MDKTITYQGRSLYYRVTGEGTPVVFVHGLAEDGEGRDRLGFWKTATG
jgi:pimeloyl-ACP methyl ester carboxylesterase